MKKTAVVVGVLACVLGLVLVVPGCKLVDDLFGEPTIKSPISGQMVTGSELVAERDRAEADAKAKRAALRAKLESALVRAKNDAESALAEIKAEYEPQLESIDAELALVASNFTLGSNAITAKFEKRDGILAEVDRTLQTAGTIFPGAKGALAIGGWALGALGGLFGWRKARQAVAASKEASTARQSATTLRGHLENVVDALDHVEAGTPMIDRDPEYRSWLGDSTAAAIKAISDRHQPRVDPAVTGKAV